jgi:hypothetical protein
MPGHCGYVYQGLGSAYLGRATPRTLTMVPDATVLTARALAKVSNAEQGHLGVVALLVRLGASPLLAGQNRAAWPRWALGRCGTRATTASPSRWAARAPSSHGPRSPDRRIRTRSCRTRVPAGRPDRSLVPRGTGLLALVLRERARPAARPRRRFVPPERKGLPPTCRGGPSRYRGGLRGCSHNEMKTGPIRTINWQWFRRTDSRDD